MYRRQLANARRVTSAALIGTCIGKSLCYYLRGEEFRGANTRRVVHFIEVFIRKYHSYLVSFTKEFDLLVLGSLVPCKGGCWRSEISLKYHVPITFRI